MRLTVLTFEQASVIAAICAHAHLPLAIERRCACLKMPLCHPGTVDDRALDGVDGNVIYDPSLNDTGTIDWSYSFAD